MRLPLGVYDEPAPEDVPLLRSVSVGGGFAAKAARFGTNLVDEATDLLDAITPF